MILHNALTSLEGRDAHRKGRQKGFVSCSTWDRCRGEYQSWSCCPAGHVQAHSDSPSLLHNPAAQAAPFLFSTRTETKLRELRGGEGDFRVWLQCLLHGGDRWRCCWCSAALSCPSCSASPAVPQPSMQTPPFRFVLWALVACRIPAWQRDHAAAGGCDTQQVVLCLACLPVTAPVSPISGSTYPKSHSLSVIEVNGFLCEDIKVGIAE